VAPGWLPFLRDHTWLHLQICAVAIAAWLLVRNLLNSSTGRAIKAAAANEDAAAAMGVPVGRTMTLTYGFGAMLGAIGGGLWVIQVRGVSTDEFDVLRSIILYAVVVFGGSSSLGGACMGALLFVSAGWLIAKFGWRFSPNMIYAIVLLAVTAFFSGGLAEAVSKLVGKVVVIVEPIPDPVVEEGRSRGR
jgi:branched-chain amino acid transport system permease protein